MGEDTTGPPSGRRVSVDEAARALGLTVDAVRKRVQRGTIEHEKDGAGRVRIILDSPDNTSTVQDESPETTGHTLIAAKDETIEELRDRVRALEEANRENRRVILALTSRIPQLEAPRGPTEDAETVEEEPERAEPQSDTPGPQMNSQRPRSGGLRGLRRRILGW